MSDNQKILGHIGVGGQKGYIYSVSGCICCLPASQWKDPCKIVIENPDRRTFLDNAKIQSNS